MCGKTRDVAVKLVAYQRLRHTPRSPSLPGDPDLVPRRERTPGSELRGPHFPPHRRPPAARRRDHSPGCKTVASRGCRERSRGPFNLRGIARPRPADMTSPASRAAISASRSQGPRLPLIRVFPRRGGNPPHMVNDSLNKVKLDPVGTVCL